MILSKTSWNSDRSSKTRFSAQNATWPLGKPHVCVGRKARERSDSDLLPEFRCRFPQAANHSACTHRSEKSMKSDCASNRFQSSVERIEPFSSSRWRLSDHLHLRRGAETGFICSLLGIAGKFTDHKPLTMNEMSSCSGRRVACEDSTIDPQQLVTSKRANRTHLSSC